MTQPAKIVDHVWRPSHNGGTRSVTVVSGCAYMGCGRPRAEHERAVKAASGWRPGKPARP